MVRKKRRQTAGIKSLVEMYRRIFEVPENLNYYSETDYKVAEKKFVKYAILEGEVRKQEEF